MRSSRPMRCLRMIESSSQVATTRRPASLLLFAGPPRCTRLVALATSRAPSLADPVDLDQRRAPAVEAGRGVGVLEAVDDGRDILR